MRSISLSLDLYTTFETLRATWGSSLVQKCFSLDGAPTAPILAAALLCPWLSGFFSLPHLKKGTQCMRYVKAERKRQKQLLEQLPNKHSSGFVVCFLRFVCGKPAGVLQPARVNEHHFEEQRSPEPAIWKAGQRKRAPKHKVNKKNTLSNQASNAKWGQFQPGNSNQALWFFTPLHALIVCRISSFSFMTCTFTISICNSNACAPTLEG